MTAYLPDDLPERIAALRILVSRLERVAAGASPIARELAWAPRLEGWEAASLTSPAVLGAVDGRAVITGRMWALDPRLAWALTEEGWVRLGSRADP